MPLKLGKDKPPLSLGVTDAGRVAHSKMLIKLLLFLCDFFYAHLPVIHTEDYNILILKIIF